MSFITGVGLTPYGKHEGSSSLDLMSKAAQAALDDAGLKRADIDGILCGYSTVSPHIMLATVFAEHFGIRPTYAHAVQVGGATGLAMTMLAHHLVDIRRVPQRARRRRREPPDRAEPRCLDPGAGAGRPSRLRGAARPDHSRLLRSGRHALHARIRRDRRGPRRIRGADARARLHPSRRAIPRSHHGRRRHGLEAGGDAAKTARLLPGVRRRCRLRHQPRADRRGGRAHPRLRPGAYASACHRCARA